AFSSNTYPPDLPVSSIRSLSPLRATLFPYTTLFRSQRHRLQAALGKRLGLLHPLGDALRRIQKKIRDAQRRQAGAAGPDACRERSEEHTSELQSRGHLVCRLLLEKKKSK